MVAKHIHSLICSTYGHTLVLFTSYTLMGSVYQILRDSLPFPMVEAVSYTHLDVYKRQPTGNLDSVTSEEVLELMKKMSEQFHQTIVMITHDPNIASKADRTIKISDGKVIA